jgi:hypothetical protein
MNTFGEKVTLEPNNELRRADASVNNSSSGVARRWSCEGRWYDM